MENITITQDQLLDIINRTMCLSKDYVIKGLSSKADNNGNFIVIFDNDPTNFFILRKSMVDYLATKSSVYISLEESYNQSFKKIKDKAKELINREDEIKSLREELKSLRDDKKRKSYEVLKVSYDELYKTHEKLLSDHNKLQIDHADLKYKYEETLKEYNSFKTGYDDLFKKYNIARDDCDYVENLRKSYEDLQHISDSYKNELEDLRTANKNLRAANENYDVIKSQNDKLVVSYNQLESNYKYVLNRNEELNSVVKNNNTEIITLRDTVEALRAKIKTQNAIIEIDKEKIEKQDKEIQSYKNINKQSKSDL